MIFIEGLPGTGKSSTALNLKRELQARGHDFSLFLETDGDSPLRYKEGTSLNDNVDEFSETMLRHWADFLSSNTQNTIVESLLIQQQVNLPIALDKENEGKILIRKLFELIPESTLIYLYNSDPVESFYSSMESRGESWKDTVSNSLRLSPWVKNRNIAPDESVEKFINEISRVTAELLQEFPHKVVRINVDHKNWDEVLNRCFNICLPNKREKL